MELLFSNIRGSIQWVKIVKSNLMAASEVCMASGWKKSIHFSSLNEFKKILFFVWKVWNFFINGWFDQEPGKVFISREYLCLESLNFYLWSQQKRCSNNKPGRKSYTTVSDFSFALLTFLWTSLKCLSHLGSTGRPENVDYKGGGVRWREESFMGPSPRSAARYCYFNHQLSFYEEQSVFFKLWRHDYFNVNSAHEGGESPRCPSLTSAAGW